MIPRPTFQCLWAAAASLCSFLPPRWERERSHQCLLCFSGCHDAPGLQSHPSMWRLGNVPSGIVLWAITGSLWVHEQVVSGSKSLQLPGGADVGWSAGERWGPAPSFSYQNLASGWGSLGLCLFWFRWQFAHVTIVSVEMTWKSVASSCKGKPAPLSLSPEGLGLVQLYWIQRSSWLGK